MYRFRHAAGFIPALLATMLVAASATAQVNSANVSLSRDASGTVAAGETISVTVSMTSAPPQGVEILGLGLRETLPANATFQGVTASSSTNPSVKPSVGAEGVLEFAWIDVPAFPYTMTYSVLLGAEFTPPQAITGQVEYRTTGGAEFSNSASTTLEEEGSAWKTGIFAGCAAGGADVSSNLADLFLMGMVMVALFVARRMQTATRLERQRVSARR